MSNDQKIVKHHRAAIAIGWDSIPWLTEESKSEILASTPPHLRDTVSKGVPSIGFGAVYPIPLDSVLVKFEDLQPIPTYWRRCYGLDVGARCTAAVFIAHDPDNDVVYVTGEHYVKDQPHEVHAAAIRKVAGDWMPGMIDPSSQQGSQTDQKKLIIEYRRQGLRVWPADNSVAKGIQEVYSRLAAGKLKFYPNVPNLQTEYLLYRYDDNNANPKPVKMEDHALDALRYAIMGLNRAQVPPVTSEMIIGGPGSMSKRRYDV